MSEFRFIYILDKLEFESFLKILDKMIQEFNVKRLFGFIRYILILLLIVMYWIEMGVRIWYDMVKDLVVFWDVIGFVISLR